MLAINRFHILNRKLDEWNGFIWHFIAQVNLRDFVGDTCNPGCLSVGCIFSNHSFRNLQ